MEFLHSAPERYKRREKGKMWGEEVKRGDKNRICTLNCMDVSSHAKEMEISKRGRTHLKKKRRKTC